MKLFHDVPLGLELINELTLSHLGVSDIQWSPHGKQIAAACTNGTIIVWDAKDWHVNAQLKHGNNPVRLLTWCPVQHQTIAFAQNDLVRVWHFGADSLQHWRLSSNASVDDILWYPDGSRVAVTNRSSVTSIDVGASGIESQDRVESAAGTITWDSESRLRCFTKDVAVRAKVSTSRLEDFPDARSKVAQLTPKGILVRTDASQLVIVVERPSGRTLQLEGHKYPITSLSASLDGKYLASISLDGLRIWDTSSWSAVVTLTPRKSASDKVYRRVLFNPRQNTLAVFDRDLRTINLFQLHSLQLKASTTNVQRHLSAKVVLVGESNAGKSCLALRLVENRYEEQGTTHAMRFWSMDGEALSNAPVPAGEHREVILWDLGGQDEYRLIHQLFLHDTTIALVLFDPTRGRSAFDDVNAWNKRLATRTGASKLLIGSKFDQGPRETFTDKTTIDNLVTDGGFTQYIPTSARTAYGVDVLKNALIGLLDWDRLAQTSRPELFQKIRNLIERKRRQEVVMLLDDLGEQLARENSETYDLESLDAVIRQLALQGVIVDTRLSTGERALVLQVGEIERYAGSILLVARDNPRGVPAIERLLITSPKMQFPGISAATRLPRLQERIVLECVVQLLLQHGICLQHEGLLVFPSLFRPTERSGEPTPSQVVSLHYDFSGAVDNIYSSLVAALALGSTFGRVKLWEDRAEFEHPGQGVCGLRKKERPGGFAYVDIYFADKTPEDTRDLFTSFVEDHLKLYGITVAETICITCPCGFQFADYLLRERIVHGKTDVGCPRCDSRSQIEYGAEQLREKDPRLRQKTWALKTRVERIRAHVIKETRRAMEQTVDDPATPIRILHLSDLHMREDTDVDAILQPLEADLQDKEDGLALTRLDYLVVSGDLTNRATPAEFEVARKFTSKIVNYFGLSAERCVVVPGNHDLSWEEDVYQFKMKRQVDVAKLKGINYVEQGDGYLIRDEAKYPNRFRTFGAMFYHPLIQKPYPLSYSEQAIPYLFPETRLQFLGLNSAWEIDEHFRGRSSISAAALARGLTEADRQIAAARTAGSLPADASVLRLAVWHHPVTGNEKIEDDAFLERLQQKDFKLCLHGHVHEERADVVGYIHPRRIRVVGGGSFGAPAEARPESTPRLYNLLEISRDHRLVRVHTRALRRETGAWTGWHVWPGAARVERRAFYDIGFESAT